MKASTAGNSPEKQYAMYLRKSRADLELEAMGEGETLARHQKMLQALAAKHEIHPDQITVYREVVSGDSIDQRPQMQRLLSDVYAKRYEGVLVVEVERLARGNTKDQGEVAEAFQAAAAKIITPAKVYDPNNEFDQEYFEFGLFMSRREYKTIKRRLEAGKKQSVMEGNYLLPQRVFGYAIVRTSKKDRTLEIVPEEAELVRMIFDWYTEERRSYGWIARQLTELGIPTTRNRPEWNRGTVRDMLANPTYIGKVWWGKSKTAREYRPELGKLVKVRKNGETPEIYQGKHPGIITAEQFQKAQTITATVSSPPARVNAELINPFAGLLECCSCGRKMIAIHFADERKDRICHARETICKKKSLTMEAVTESFQESLRGMIADWELKMAASSNQDQLVRHQLALQARQAELEKLERKRMRLFDDYEDGTYTRDEFIQRKQYYSQAIENAKKQLQDEKNSQPEAVNYAEQLIHLHQMIECVANDAITAKQKNDFLKQFVASIQYDAVDHGKHRGGKAVLDVFLK